MGNLTKPMERRGVGDEATEVEGRYCTISISGRKNAANCYLVSLDTKIGGSESRTVSV